MSEPDPLDYDTWNRAIAARFFDGRFANRPVYLDLDDSTLLEVWSTFGLGDPSPADEVLESFRLAVAATLHVRRPGVSGSLFGEHLFRLHEWLRSGRQGIPPFVALLAFLCHAAEKMAHSGDYAPNNYYGPFCDFVGIDKDDQSSRLHAQDQFREQTPIFWDQLRLWLLQEDGRRGLPTAQAFDHRRFIGLPLSQVLIREHERQRLFDAFLRMNLRPHQQVSSRDMHRMLQEIVALHGLSGQFDRLWKASEEMRLRLSELACLELEAWDGASSESDDQATSSGAALSSRLRLAAFLRRHPRFELRFSLIASSSTACPPGTYTLGSGGFEASFELAEVTGWMQATVVPADVLRELMQDRADFVRLASKSHLVREARGVVVLGQLAELGGFVETGHLEPGTDSVLLVRERWETRVEELLLGAARPGYKHWGKGEPRGVPDGWVAFTSVQLARLPALTEDDKSDLGPLMPLVWTQIERVGGFRLPGIGTWHSLQPPEVSATALEGAPVSLVVEDGEGQSREYAFQSAMVAEIGPDAKDGDYRAFIVDARKRVLATSNVSLRSAEHPRPSNPVGEGWFGHALEGASSLSALGAITLGAQPLRGIRGAVIRGRIDRGAEDLKLPSERQVRGEDELDYLPEVPVSSVNAPPAERGCIDGAHRWRIADVNSMQGFGQDHSGSCSRCGLKKRFPAHPTDNHANHLRFSAALTPPPVAAVKSPPSLPLDLLFDAICFAQGGSFATLQNLSAQADDNPWFATELARTLSSLGHLDLELNRGTLQPERWAVAPPSLVLTEGKAFLAGFRSGRLVRKLEEICEREGLVLYHQEWPQAPSTVEIEVVSDQQALQIACELEAETEGLSLQIESDPALQIARALPSLHQLVMCLPVFAPPEGERIERFDLRSARWKPVERFGDAGAYRFTARFGRRTTAFFDGLAWRRADANLVKYLAAATEGVTLLSFKHGHLCVPVGARLPGLYERAACLRSGYPPRQLTDGTIRYEDVGEDVASIVHACLSRGEPSK